MITHRLVVKHLYLGRPPKTYCGMSVSLENYLSLENSPREEDDTGFVIHNNFNCEKCIEEFGLESLANLP